MVEETKAEIINYTLMHRNVTVAELAIHEKTGVVLDVLRSFDVTHAPLGTTGRISKQLNADEINNWLKGRSIPASRQNIERLLRKVGVPTTSALALKSYGLSLSDQYWLKPEYFTKTWEEVNFFYNEFSEDVGLFLCQNQAIPNDIVKIVSPDNNANGVLRKKWIVRDCKRILLKGDSDLNEQRPFNEEIATKLMEKLGINHVPYTTTMIDNRYYSECENFIDEYTEYITASELLVSVAPEITHKEDGRFNKLLMACDHVGMTGMRRKLEEMIVVDFILANTDRHWGNFGFIRNADTLEYQGFAPIFDTGNSLWFDKRVNTDPVSSEAFSETQVEDLKLVTDLSWYDPIPADELVTMVTKVLEKNIFLDKGRKEMIVEGIMRNAQVVAELKRDLEMV